MKDILAATENFSNEYLIGRRGFGSVYKAVLPSGLVLAIKKLVTGGNQGSKEFLAEVETLSSIKHINLVVLRGYHASSGPSADQEFLIIYDYVNGGSLEKALDKNLPLLAKLDPWAFRRKIALGAARGIRYLHEECTPKVVHRDIKPANILLTEQGEARVADFGLAKHFDLTETHVSTVVAGTIGYLAPEYAVSGQVNEKSDVFSFGIVLLQLVTGRKPTNIHFASVDGDGSIVFWVACLLPEGAPSHVLLDPTLFALLADNSANPAAAAQSGELEDEMFGMLRLGLVCTQQAAASRPSMSHIVQLLEDLRSFGSRPAAQLPGL